VPEGQIPCTRTNEEGRSDRACFQIDFWLNGKNPHAASSLEAFDRSKSSFHNKKPVHDSAGLEMYKEGPESALITFYKWGSDYKPGSASCISFGPANPKKGTCLDSVELMPGVMVTIRLFESDIDHIADVESHMGTLLESFSSKPALIQK
jgi:hypothetical protein